MRSVDILKQYGKNEVPIKAPVTMPEITVRSMNGIGKHEDTFNRATIDKIIAGVKNKMATCNLKHHNWRDAANELAGYIHTGYLSENDVRNILTDCVNARATECDSVTAAHKLIDKCIKWGQANPLQIKNFDPEYSSKKNISHSVTSDTATVTPDQVKTSIDLLRVTSALQIAEPIRVASIQNQTILSDGYLSVLGGQAKSAKTGTLNAIVAGALLQKVNSEVDTLGIDIKPNTEGKMVLHIDSEQTLYNQQRFVRSAVKRANIDTEPDFFYSYNLRSLSVREKLETLKAILKVYSELHGGVYLILIDGIADFVNSVNDEVESNAIIHEFELLAIKYDCPVLTVLHYNPGSDNKGRGHIGSQIERKCESFLSVSRKGDISTLESKMMRNGKDFHPIEFSYNESEGMHTLIGIKDPTEERNQKSRAKFELIKTFLKNGGKRRIDLVHDFMEAEGIKDRSAQTRIMELINDGIIEYNESKTLLSLSATVQ